MRRAWTVGIFALLLAGAGACGGDGRPAECEAIVEACHDIDPGSGPIHECHEFAEDEATTKEQCVAMSQECLATCTPLANTLFVGHEGQLVSYDIATGEERAGAVQSVTGPVDMQALEDGTIMVNLTGRNEILAVDPRTMLEVARIPSSGLDGVRPVHSYITDIHQAHQYWVAMNDGTDNMGNTAAFVDITPASQTRFQIRGEMALGHGHHKAAFSSTQARVVISNIGDCENVMSVYDYTDVTAIQTLATLTAADAGWTAADPGAGMFDPMFCDPTYARGVPPAPHGCATSTVSGKAYCNITSSGDMVVVDLDADPPTFTLLPTGGSGGGKTAAHPGGRYVYSVQESPRGICQIGQLAVVDAMTDTVVAEVPLGYTGPACTDDLTGTAAETANPDHLNFSADGLTMFVGIAGGFEVADARIDQLVVVDLTDPANPVQAPSIGVGVETGHSFQTLSGDGGHLFVVDSIDNTVTEVDVATRTAARTLTVAAMPRCAATYGDTEGPSHQTGPTQ
jgi:YVTN family beta-propeller protein